MPKVVPPPMDDANIVATIIKLLFLSATLAKDLKPALLERCEIPTTNNISKYAATIDMSITMPPACHLKVPGALS